MLEAIKSLGYYRIMVDESSNVPNKEQAAFCVQWVDEYLISHEDFMGFYEMEKTDTTSMVAVIMEL